MAYESYCAACTYLSEVADYNGNYWCERKGCDISASTPKCYSFCEAYSRSNSTRSNMIDNSEGHLNGGCYLTTIMCKILNYPDNNYYLNTLRNFRDNIMKTNPEYIPLLITYDTIGPIISYNLSIDHNKKDIAMAFFGNYITKAVDAINEEKYNEAINIYKAMTASLAEKYNININIISPEINKIDIKNLGHAKTKRISNSY